MSNDRYHKRVELINKLAIIEQAITDDYNLEVDELYIKIAEAVKKRRSRLNKLDAERLHNIFGQVLVVVNDNMRNYYLSYLQDVMNYHSNGKLFRIASKEYQVGSVARLNGIGLSYDELFVIVSSPSSTDTTPFPIDIIDRAFEDEGTDENTDGDIDENTDEQANIVASEM